MRKASVLLFISFLLGLSLSQVVNPVCPPELGWINNGFMCYKFSSYPQVNYREAVQRCKEDGATLLTVKTETRHNFIRNWLLRNDLRRDNWWTSGRTNNGKLYWEGDGSQSIFDKGWVVSASDYRDGYHNMIYTYNDTSFGWAVGDPWTKMSYICEISIQEVYRIAQEKRGFDYGLNIQDPSEAPRGPYFVVEPESVTVLRNTEMVFFDCVASGNPGVTYQWLRQNVDREMVPLVLNERYTTVTGRLNILNPSSANRDQGTFQCKVTNDHGTILSSTVELNFGSMSQFATVASANVEANEQMGAQLECPAISGKPGVVYQWYKNSPNSFIRPNLQTHSFISASGKLLFSEVAESDQGTYYCVASLTGFGRNINYIGSSQSVSRLSRGFDLIVRKSGGNTYSVDIQKEFIYVYPNTPTRGATVRLECFAYGSLPLTYSWGKVNRPFPEGRHKFESANRILIINNIDLSDEDTYYCNVSSSKTNTKQSTSLALEVLTKPFFIYPLHHQHIDIGTRLTWHCEAIGKPFPVYTWYRDGKKLTSSPGLTVSGNTIVISSVDTKHNGMYQCGARNEFGETFTTAQLRVLEIKPSFEKSPMIKYVIGAIGGDVTLQCNPIGAPRPVFTWYKNDTLISYGDHYQLLLNGDLRITQINKRSDEGRYKCHVENTIGKAEDYTDFKVNERADFYLKPKRDEVEVNLTVTLTCQASHAQNVDMIYIWSFNDHIINFEKEPEYRLGRGREEGYLYITGAQHKNEGIYTCAIVSASDRQDASCFVKVVGPPGEPAGVRVHELNPVMELSASDNVDLATTRWITWYDGATHGNAITHYFIEFRTEYDNNWRIHFDGRNIPVSQTTVENKDKLRYARITNLKAGASIQFRVLGRNEYGLGIPSLATRPTAISSVPPTTTVTDIRGGGGSVGDLTIWWDPLPREDHNGPDLQYRVEWRKVNKKEEKFSHKNITHSKACKTKINIEMGSMFVCQYVTTVGSALYYTEYEVRIQTFNRAGPGPMSDMAVIRSAEALPQGSPESVYALEYNATALMVFWKPVENVRERAGGTLKGYKINYWRNGIDSESQALQNIIELKKGQANLNQGLIIGLTPNTWYRFNVQAYNSAGNGLKSSTFTQETLNDVPNKFPTEVYVYSIEGKGVRVNFRGISSLAGEEPLRGYKVQVWQSNENIRSAREYDFGKKNTGVIKNLNNSILYQLRVFAYSRAGQGKRSSPTVFFTVGDGQILSNPETTEIMSVASGINSSFLLTILVVALTICMSQKTGSDHLT